MWGRGAGGKSWAAKPGVGRRQRGAWQRGWGGGVGKGGTPSTRRLPRPARGGGAPMYPSRRGRAGRGGRAAAGHWVVARTPTRGGPAVVFDGQACLAPPRPLTDVSVRERRGRGGGRRAGGRLAGGGWQRRRRGGRDTHPRRAAPPTPGTYLTSTTHRRRRAGPTGAPPRGTAQAAPRARPPRRPPVTASDGPPPCHCQQSRGRGQGGGRGSRRPRGGAAKAGLEKQHI